MSRDYIDYAKTAYEKSTHSNMALDVFKAGWKAKGDHDFNCGINVTGNVPQGIIEGEKYIPERIVNEKLKKLSEERNVANRNAEKLRQKCIKAENRESSANSHLRDAEERELNKIKKNTEFKKALEFYGRQKWDLGNLAREALGWPMRATEAEICGVSSEPVESKSFEDCGKDYREKHGPDSEKISELESQIVYWVNESKEIQDEVGDLKRRLNLALEQANFRTSEKMTVDYKLEEARGVIKELLRLKELKDNAVNKIDVHKAWSLARKVLPES